MKTMETNKHFETIVRQLQEENKQLKCDCKKYYDTIITTNRIDGEIINYYKKEIEKLHNIIENKK